jgi:GT2 family glycosyltransferase
MQDLSISIGTLGDVEVLERCLRSIYQECDPEIRFDVWVIYNGAQDPEVVRGIRQRWPQVRLVVCAGPLGYCATHNLTLERCQSRYVLILDDDTLVPRGTLARMVRFMDENPHVGVSGCKTLNMDGSYQLSFGLVPTLRTEIWNMIKPDSFWPGWLYEGGESPREVEWLNGSFMLARREAIGSVGGLDEHYYTYVCEPDWCHRMRCAGWKVVYVPDVEIFHEGGEHSRNSKFSATDAVALTRYHVNRFYFFRKHHGSLAQWLLRPIMAFGSALRILFWARRLLGGQEMQQVAKVRIRAFWRVIGLSFSPRPYELPADLRASDSRTNGELRQRRAT